MKHRTTQILYAYWNEVRAGRIAPRRLEIEPARIAGILPDTFMLEHHDAATYQYRLAGSRVCELFGRELRGTNFLEGWSVADRLALARRLSTMREQGGVVLLEIAAANDAGHRIELEVLLLPLVHVGTQVGGRILGAISTTGPVLWLGSARLDSKRLQREEVIWPDGRPHSLLERSGRQAPFLPAAMDGRLVRDQRRNFRVLQGGRSLREPRE
ncbi:MAG TPA: PAS domain-containing protein [Hyphomicrobiaceae bacterium]|nr:PAS domain-containing protein [Hyphomicrobiaceae bacterium]